MGSTRPFMYCPFLVGERGGDEIEFIRIRTRLRMVFANLTNFIDHLANTLRTKQEIREEETKKNIRILVVFLHQIDV